MKSAVGLFTLIAALARTILADTNSTDEGPLVETNVGKIRGVNSSDGDYAMYLGIPYGQVQADNPFGESFAYPVFNETFIANNDSVMCPQVDQVYKKIQGSVDCLNLNVFVPTSASSENLLPVMVWIYGGSFKNGYYGTYIYGPSYLVKHDVILVTMNYRVGPYGFMCLGTADVPGNQGLKDQYLAMQWVKDNIEGFGGDSDNITLFGESAGGHSVDFHLLSEKDTVYNKVILQSGSSLSYSVFVDPDTTAPLKIAKSIGLNSTTNTEAIAALAGVDSDLVISTAIALNITFKPCIETEFDGVEPFLSSSWINADVPKVKDMPVLIGFNELEAILFYNGKNDSYYKNLNTVPGFLTQMFNLSDTDYEDMNSTILQFYMGDKPQGLDAFWEMMYMISDYTYIHPVQRTIRKYLTSGAGNIYYYLFSYVGGRNSIKITGPDNRTCCTAHADDLSYLFNVSYKPEPTTQDQLVVDRLTTMWTNFAKYGDPTPETTDLLPVKWVPLTEDTYTYMNISSELSLGSRPNHERMSFWDLFYKLNEKSQRNYVEN